MEYWIYEKQKELITRIGESSFNNFFCDDGYYIMMKMLDDECDFVSDLLIKKDDGTEISVEEFSKEIENLQKVYETYF